MKGYTSITLKDDGESLYLQPTSFVDKEDEFTFFIDYEDGKIFIDYQDGTPTKIIGYYEQQADDPRYAKVFDSTKERVIGRVGNEFIIFVKHEADPSVGRYSAEEKCLAYYTENGSITGLRALPFIGRFQGNDFGGPAAFVAVFYAYNFKSVFRDYLEMEKEAFEEKHKDYPPFGW